MRHAPTLSFCCCACPQSRSRRHRRSPRKLGQCVACHGSDGRGRIAGTPHLAGQDEAYLASALAAYRSGTRRAAIMNSIANTLQARDIAALARWYARQPAGGPARPQAKP
jgi:cytochrome c553